METPKTVVDQEVMQKLVAFKNLLEHNHHTYLAWTLYWEAVRNYRRARNTTIISPGGPATDASVMDEASAEKIVLKAKEVLEGVCLSNGIDVPTFTLFDACELVRLLTPIGDSP